LRKQFLNSCTKISGRFKRGEVTAAVGSIPVKQIRIERLDPLARRAPNLTQKYAASRRAHPEVLA
jgi:hypothetical protein